MTSVAVRRAAPAEYASLAALYEAWGYGGGIAPGDVVYVALDGQRPVGIVRRTREEGVTMLRGMQVAPDVRRRGVGRRLLAVFEAELDDAEPCLCVPYAHLTAFYGAIGFTLLDERSAPPFLRARLAAYRAQGLDVCLMIRPAVRRRGGEGSFAIRRAAAGEGAPMAALAADLFREAYGPTHPEPTLSEYLTNSFAPGEVERRIADPARTWLVVETPGGEWCGYAELHAGAPDDGRVRLARPLPGSAPLEIVRFYVAPSGQGRGVAQTLMRACEDAATSRGCDVLWLQAWQRAAQALRFYEKVGFTIVGTAVFRFGDRLDDDYVLAKGVRTLAPGEDRAEID